MSDDPENWELLQELFLLTEETPEGDQERVLLARCGDGRIVARTLTILEGARRVEKPDNHSSAKALKGRIGPYSLIRLLGSGGIGSVYLAERILGGAPQRSALKVLSPHAAGPSFIERFHREQHILGSLDHPHITRLLDAGLSDTGQPYLVMEYVEGEHFDTYCNSRRLNITQRIALFLQVCDAVACAHRNLIVHLDLKPSNILVNTSGEVKLLDFGTSKLVQTDSLLTTTVLATPAFASPEQLRNEPVTTACDVYSLGAVLYDLLAGSRATDTAAIMFDRALNERDPKALPDAVSAAAAEDRGVSEAKLRQTLTGDLATITAKCLRSRPKDRYPSVDALANDLRRYLDGRSVLARPQTAMYRIGKFVRRNRGSVVATGLATLALLASIGYAAWRQEQAVQQGRRAVHMQTFMYRLFKLANSNYTGKPAATVPEFLALGVKMLPDYIKDSTDLRQAQLGLAESMYENGDLDRAQTVADNFRSRAERFANAQNNNNAHLLPALQSRNVGDVAAVRAADASGHDLRLRAWVECREGSQGGNCFAKVDVLQAPKGQLDRLVALIDGHNLVQDQPTQQWLAAYTNHQQQVAGQQMDQLRRNAAAGSQILHDQYVSSSARLKAEHDAGMEQLQRSTDSSMRNANNSMNARSTAASDMQDYSLDRQTVSGANGTYKTSSQYSNVWSSPVGPALSDGRTFGSTDNTIDPNTATDNTWTKDTKVHGNGQPY